MSDLFLIKNRIDAAFRYVETELFFEKDRIDI